MGGHYVAFTDYYVKNGKHYFYTKDSGSRNRDSAKNGYYTYEGSMKGLIYQMWIVEKPKAIATSATKVTTNTSSSVTGVFDKTNVKALQKLFGTTQDGIISGQLASLKQYHKGFKNCIKYGTGGSALVKAIQKYLNMSGPDGYLGPNTIKAIQKFVGTTADGIWGEYTSKAVQNWIIKNPTLPQKKTNTTKIKGMDVSTWQGNISKANFEKAKASGIEFVILRIGYTGSKTNKPTIDDTFENNYKNAIAAGLPVGIYYYSLATTEAKAKEEANFCISKLKGKKITYPVYIDVEDPSKQAKQSKATLAAVCNVFCNTIKAAGYKPGVYASLSWFNDKIGNITANHSKWVAQYNKTCDYKGTYDIWQYSSSEAVPGIGNKVDVNWCYKKF
jgi:GH25 family lysozyme M1 (1,4-beta-N-acetylmuramidase)